MTLNDKIHGRSVITKGVSGPGTYLTSAQETRLVNFLLHMAKSGFGIVRKDILLVVKKILDDCVSEGYVIPAGKKFVDNKPSNCWIYSFLKRHPEISARTPESLGFQRAYLTEEQIRNWFQGLKTYLRTEHALDVLEFLSENNGEHIFNIDESGFPLHGTNGKMKIIAEKGSRYVHKLSTDNKEQITFLACISAKGEYSKPLVIFPGKRTPNFNLRGVDPDKYDIGYSPNGWISTEAFFSWLANVFYPSVCDKIQFPIMILMDGHRSHINIAATEFCIDHGIILYCLPPHSSHILQPLDISCFGPIKKLWNSAIDDFKSMHNIAMNRAHFFPVFDKAWSKASDKKHSVGGFRRAGLVPYNPDAIDYNVLILKHTNETIEEQTSYATSPGYEQKKLGFAMAFVMYEQILSEEQKLRFEKRFEEGFDMSDHSLDGRMWLHYKQLRMAMANMKNYPILSLPQSLNNRPGHFNESKYIGHNSI